MFRLLMLTSRNLIKIQFESFKIVHQSGKRKLLEDYAIGFYDSIDSIAKYSEERFNEKLINQVVPASQIAINMGFSGNWEF